MDGDGLLATLTAGGIALLVAGSLASLAAALPARPWLVLGPAGVALVVGICLWGRRRVETDRTPYWG
jgi:hypothetical protein